MRTAEGIDIDHQCLQAFIVFFHVLGFDELVPDIQKFRLRGLFLFEFIPLDSFELDVGRQAVRRVVGLDHILADVQLLVLRINGKLYDYVGIGQSAVIISEVDGHQGLRGEVLLIHC